MVLKETVDFHIKSTWHSITRMYNLFASEFSLSQTIGYVLINIEKEGTPATKIAPLMGMEPTSLSRLLKNMEDNGLIYRKGDETDKRIVRIYLTETGIEKRKIAKQTILDFNTKLINRINEKDMNVFIKVLTCIKEQVNLDISEFQSKINNNNK
ncbi:MAG: MarR family transcriptional regulator [Bacteroidales bacterium]|nr:MarR family transcriptional regulator [Bacteroidales bacterium]MBN2757195.1 MarR family transcriptional regulator [Bacteroidales bacterium]